MTKKTLLAGILTLAMLAVPAQAGVMMDDAPAADLAAGTLIYYEDFEGLYGEGTDDSLDALGWTKSENLLAYTAQLSIDNGYLSIDNLDETVGTSNDSYAVMMDDDYLAKFAKGDYTYQYDVTYRGAGNSYRYVSLLVNYDGNNNYDTVDMRMRGDGYNQTRRGTEWIHYNDTTSPIRATDDTAILTQLFGVAYDENAYSLQDKTITVRVEVSQEKGPTVYVNGIKVSEMAANADKWGTLESTAMAFKASNKVKADIDNIMIWAGTGVEPDMSVFEPEVEETVAEVVEGAADAEAAAPQTFDAGVIAAVAAIVSAAGYAISKKR
ncbi:MAG: hypothetical protein IJX14_01710 [Clostridia bacterium]|nr:hypothetical protein [Clostridia bacterium]